MDIIHCSFNISGVVFQNKTSNKHLCAENLFIQILYCENFENLKDFAVLQQIIFQLVIDVFFSWINDN